ncbi:MAG: hypothetical protein JW841_08415 [Deltaproteobacteria bacterium]|nr:hypothetical protein [Deltaproteobacteria bacterium]
MKDQTRHSTRVKRFKQLPNKNNHKSDRCTKNAAKTQANINSKVSSPPPSGNNYHNAVIYLKKQYRKCLAMLDELAHLGESYREDAMAHAEQVDKRFDESSRD